MLSKPPNQGPYRHSVDSGNQAKEDPYFRGGYEEENFYQPQGAYKIPNSQMGYPSSSLFAG